MQSLSYSTIVGHIESTGSSRGTDVTVGVRYLPHPRDPPDVGPSSTTTLIVARLEISDQLPQHDNLPIISSLPRVSQWLHLRPAAKAKWVRPPSLHPTPTTPLTPPSVQLNTLPLPQLHALQKQLNSELQHLTSSFQSLRAAQAKFRDCIAALATALAADRARPVLVPMTESLYVPATLADADTVLVDVGTGYFVEKDRAQAREFYERKVADLEKNLRDLEGIVSRKAENVRAVEESKLVPLGWSRPVSCIDADPDIVAIREKVVAGGGQSGAEAASAA